MAIVLPVLVVVQALAPPATTLASCCKHLRVNNAKIIASFNFNMVPDIISCDKHIGTFGSSILSNIIMLRGNVTMEKGDVSSYVLSYSYVLLLQVTIVA